MALLALCHVVLSIWTTKSTASFEASLRASKKWQFYIGDCTAFNVQRNRFGGKTHKSLNIYIYIGIWIYDQPDHVISYPALHIQKSTTNISSTFLNLYYSAGGFENTFCCGIRRPNHLGNEIDWPVLSFRRALLNHYVSLQGCSKMSQLASPVFWSALTMQCWCPSSYLLYSLPFSASLSSSSSSRACMNGACTCFSTSKFNVPDVAVACHTHSNNPKLAKYLTWPTMTCKLHQCREMERSFRHRQIYKEGNLGIDHKSLALEKKKSKAQSILEPTTPSHFFSSLSFCLFLRSFV